MSGRPVLTVSGWSYDPDNLAVGFTDVHFYHKDFSQADYQFLFNLATAKNVSASTLGTVTAIRDMGIIRPGKSEVYQPAISTDYGFVVTAPLPAQFVANSTLEVYVYGD